VASELPDADRYRQARDQRQDHRQGRGSTRIADCKDDRECDRRCGSHVGDGLKENLWETYRVSLKARVSRLSRGSHESLPPLAIGRV
jgi:hypothetical protein